MKSKEFFEMNDKELSNKIAELKSNLFNLRFKHATNQLSNPMVIAQCKKDIARAMTVQNQRALAAKKAK